MLLLHHTNVDNRVTSTSADQPSSSRYERMGAYHWAEADPSWRNLRYNAPLSARYDVILDSVPPTSRAVLDAGCGDGYLVHLLHQRGFRCVIGMDNDQLAVQLARDQLREYDAAPWNVGAASIYALPLASHSVDCVIMADVIEHLDEPEKALAEVTRVLTPGGTLVLSTPNGQADREWDASHVREYKPEELRTVLASFFQETGLYACWPMWCFRLWLRGMVWRQFLRYLSRIARNPFATLTSEASPRYGQLIAVCSKQASRTPTFGKSAPVRPTDACKNRPVFATRAPTAREG